MAGAIVFAAIMIFWAIVDIGSGLNKIAPAIEAHTRFEQMREGRK